MSKAQPEPSIDFTKLTFPSDRLTIASIRGAFPHLFSQEMPLFFEDAFHSSDFSSILWLERIIAHKAFAAVLGRPDPHPESDKSRRNVARMLGEAYIDFGLCEGVRSGKELVQGIERAAQAQAQQHLGQDLT